MAHHPYHERRNDASSVPSTSSSSTLSLLILRDDRGLFCRDSYILLPNIEGQVRAATMQSSDSKSEEYDDTTFRCAVPLSDGGTSICTFIHKKTSTAMEEEMQSVCEYIKDASLEYELGTDEFRRRYPNKRERNIGRFDPRVDAIVLLVKSNRELDSFIHLMREQRQKLPPLIVGALRPQVKMELKRRINSDVEHYKDVFMIIDASSSAGIESTFVKRFFSRREILRAKDFAGRFHLEQEKQHRRQQRLRKSAERSSSWFARFFFGDRSKQR